MSTQREPWYALSTDTGGLMTKAAVVDNLGHTIYHLSVPTDTTVPPEAVPDWLIRLIQRLMDGAAIPEDRIAGICVGIPGVIDRRTDTIVSCPNLANWEGIRLAALVQDKTGLPAYLEKDANQAALGEWWLGAGQGVDHLVCFTIGAGIGTGIILDGKLYRGSLGGAGEIGHITLTPDGPRCSCGNRGCLEALASAIGIVREARAAMERDPQSRLWALAGGQPQTLTAEMVFAAARERDYTAQEVVHHAVEYLGIGVSNVVNIFNPDVVVIGGGVALAGEQLLAPVRRVVQQRARRLVADHVRVVQGALGEVAGAIGGAYMVFESQNVPLVMACD